MAIALEFINFLVPRTAICARYPGGWVQCLRDHHRLLGGRVYYDENLFHDGAMDPADIDRLLREWTARGLKPTRMVDEREVANDVCVIDVFGGKLWPCDWITRASAFVVHFSGIAPGRLVGPRDVRKVAAACQVKQQLKKIAAEPSGLADEAP